MITLRRARNVFTGDFAEVQVPYGSTFHNYVPSNFHPGRGTIHYNGLPVELDDVADLKVADGSTIDFIDGTSEGLTAFLIISSVIGVAASLAQAFLLKPKIPRLASTEQEVKPDPTFQGIQTTVGPLQKIPFVLGGPLRIGGHIGESFTNVKYSYMSDADPSIETVPDSDIGELSSRTLSTRIFWGWGPFESIGKYELDDNPYTNLKGLRIQTVLGTLTQAPFEGFDAAKNNRDQSGQGTVTQSGGAKVASTIAPVDTVEVELRFTQGLFSLGAGNQFYSRDLEVEFSYRKTDEGGGYTVYKRLTISAATRASHPVYVLFPVLDLDRYDIKVERITADTDADPTITDAFIWNVLTEVRFGARSHPGLAQTGFQQIPQAQVSVPRKYTAEVKGASNVRQYMTPTTYRTSWTNSPAWCFLHWVTNPIFGLGKFNTYEENVDIESFMELAEKCNEDVSDGKGGVEKRATFAFEFRRQMRAIDIVQIFERACGCSLVEEAGKWRAVIHQSRSRMMVINEGMYERASARVDFDVATERPTRTMVRFQNKDLNFADDTVPVEDTAAAPLEQLIQTTETRWGVTSRQQARRLGHLDLNQARLAKKIIELTAGPATLRRKAGERVGIATLASGVGVANGRLRVVSDSRTRLRIDRDVTLNPAKTYELVVGHAVKPGVESVTSTLTLTNVTTHTTDWIDVLLVAPNSLWKAQPQIGDAYCLGEVGFAIEDYVIEDITLDEKFRRHMVCSFYDEAMFDETKVVEDSTTRVLAFNPNVIPGPVQALVAEARKVGGSAHVIDVSWEPPLGDFIIAAYEVCYRLSGTTSWICAAVTPVNNAHISGELEASTTYEVVVRAVSATERRLAFADAASPVSVTTLA